FGVSYINEMREQTPTDGKVCGFGEVNGRPVGVVSYDFTVKGSSSSATNNKKMSHIKDIGAKRGFPTVFLSESTGIRMPDVMGEGMGNTNEAGRFLRRREAPWVSAVMGFAFGSAAWHACASDFTVMRKGSVMAVASPRMVTKALKRTITGEELGGWRVHAEATDMLKTFLSYLPSHANESPPVVPVPPESGQDVQSVLSLLPESPYQVYDVRKVVELFVDFGSFFELKARFGR